MTHSFMSAHFARKLDRFGCNMEEPLIATTLLKEVFVVKYVYKSYVVLI